MTTIPIHDLSPEMTPLLKVSHSVSPLPTSASNPSAASTLCELWKAATHDATLLHAVNELCAGERRSRSSRRCCIPPAALRPRGRPGPLWTAGRGTRSSSNMRVPALSQVRRACACRARRCRKSGVGGGSLTARLRRYSGVLRCVSQMSGQAMIRQHGCPSHDCPPADQICR